MLDWSALQTMLDQLTAGSIFAMACMVISLGAFALYLATRWREFLVASGSAAVYVVPIMLHNLRLL